MLFAYNKTVAPLLLAASSSPVTLPASQQVGERGVGVNVTNELKNLTGAQYGLLQNQVDAGFCDLEWTDAVIAYKTPGLNLLVAPATNIMIGDLASTGTGNNFAKPDHRHGLPAPNPPENVNKSAALAGTSPRAARDDHKHDVMTGAPVDIGFTNAEGSSSSLARADHVHAFNGFLTYSNATRPAANSVSPGYVIFNTSDKSLNISDGTNWYSPTGIIT